MKSIHSPSYQAALAWLRASRKERGLSMRDVGLIMGMPHTWIGKVETGERRLDLDEYVRLCRAIGIKPSRGLAIVEAALPAYPSASNDPLPKAADRAAASYRISKRT